MRLARTVYLFGSVHDRPYGYMTFSPDGRVTTYQHPNESRYRFEPDGSIAFLTAGGEVTSVLRPDHAEGAGFRPGTGAPLYLQPILALDSAPPPKNTLPPVFVNSTPKAGTYLVARALEHLGYVNSGVHAMDDFLHDNRGVPEDEIHWEPSKREKLVPVHALAALLQNGEFAVGHLNRLDRMHSILCTGTLLLNIVREPQAQLLSMFVFQQKKVKPSPAARLWQNMAGIEAFKAFLLSCDLDLWVTQQRTIVENLPYLRFEDLFAPEVKLIATSHEKWQQLMEEPLLGLLPSALEAARGKPTSTYIPGDRSDMRAWLRDPDIIDYLESKGTLSLSRDVWPELN